MRACLAGAVVAVAAIAVSCTPPPQAARQTVDPQLGSEIASIKAIDNHAHPVRLLDPGETDPEVDALPVEMMEPYETLPVRLRPGNTEFAGAWRELFGYRHGDLLPEHVKQGAEAKQSAMRDKGDAYSAWVLDRLGIEIMMANRVAMGRGLVASRFKWIPFADPFMYPFHNERLAKHDPDRKAFFAAERKLLDRYLHENGTPAMPGTLADYQRTITATLERWKQNGAAGIKFEMAYLRSLAVGDAAADEAGCIYPQALRAAAMADPEYKVFQDYIFRFIAGEAGRLKLPVQIHASKGAGRYYDVPGANPALLTSVMTDPALRNTQFILVHGGWPYVNEAAALLDIPNVWLDFSIQTLVQYPRSLSNMIRTYLEYVPEKVLFGTDAGPFGETLSWEETGWLSASTGRESLGMALTAMMRDGQITRERAIELAHMVMRDNARRLYGLQ